MLHADIELIKIGHHVLCQDLTLTFEPGQLYCLLGANGSGKTSLLHTLSGLKEQALARVYYDGTLVSQMPAKKRACTIGVLLQDQQLPGLNTVYESLYAARYPHRALWQQPSKSDEQAIQYAIEAMELTHLLHQPIYQLSGGEQQRLLMGMLLTQAPEIYIVDEPTNHLDIYYQIRTLKCLKRLAREYNRTIITVLHDINLAYQFADYVCLLHADGHTQYGPVQETLTASALTALYHQPVQAYHVGGGWFFWFG